MATLHIDHSTEEVEDYLYIDQPTASQIKDAIENCGAVEFTWIEITGNWKLMDRSKRQLVI